MIPASSTGGRYHPSRLRCSAVEGGEAARPRDVRTCLRVTARQRRFGTVATEENTPNEDERGDTGTFNEGKTTDRQWAATGHRHRFPITATG